MQDFTSEAGKRFKDILISTAKGRHGARDLTRETAREALSFLFSAEAHPVQIGAFLTAMRFKSAKPEEMQGFLDAMEAAATLIAPKAEFLINCNGPYDGRKRALNLSVASAIVAASAGASVILHSNTGLPPKNGVTNARTLEALGIPAAREPEQIEKDLEEQGFGHLHASVYLHGVERLKPLRQTLHYRSFLHACEVMLNPAGARRSLIGAAHEGFLEKFALAAGPRNMERVMVVQGLDGGDELPLDLTPVVEYRDGELHRYDLDPQDYGLKQAQHMPCPSPLETAQEIEQLLTGASDRHLDAVLFNAGVRLELSGKCDSIEAGIAAARDALQSGKAKEKLQQLRG